MIFISHFVDPAVGSGHFLVSALNEIISIKNDLNILQDKDGKRLKDYNIDVENDELIITDEDGRLFEYNPHNNIYFLLCYAWNKLDEKDRVNISIDDKTELLDLFAKVLINATKILLKRGIEKDYIEHTEELVGVKGKVEIAETIKSNLLFKLRTICTFDDFSANIISNRILVTTIYKPNEN